MSVVVKRIYEPATKADGYRVLVDRLWPRGIKKENAQADLWLKEVAPAAELRQWFAHDAAKWAEFLERYYAAVKDTQAFATLQKLVQEQERVTLLYAAAEEHYNNARALLLFLER